MCSLHEKSQQTGNGQGGNRGWHRQLNSAIAQFLSAQLCNLTINLALLEMPFPGLKQINLQIKGFAFACFVWNHNKHSLQHHRWGSDASEMEAADGRGQISPGEAGGATGAAAQVYAVACRVKLGLHPEAGGQQTCLLAAPGSLVPSTSCAQLLAAFTLLLPLCCGKPCCQALR